MSFEVTNRRVDVRSSQGDHAMLRKLAVLLLLLSLSQVLLGQANPTVVTNSDLIKMVAAGIGDQTIILAIQRGPTILDTSPQALILLKNAGVSDQALNTILAATKSQSQPHAEPSQSASASSPDKSLNAVQKDEHRHYRPPENPRTGSLWHLWRSKS
jgi:hypothetical protein